MESKVNNFSTLLNITKENTKCRNFFVYEKYENNKPKVGTVSPSHTHHTSVSLTMRILNGVLMKLLSRTSKNWKQLNYIEPYHGKLTSKHSCVGNEYKHTD
jgi:hypothetical protein